MLTQLPAFFLENIFQHLDETSLTRGTRVCKDWRTVIKNDTFLRRRTPTTTWLLQHNLPHLAHQHLTLTPNWSVDIVRYAFQYLPREIRTRWLGNCPMNTAAMNGHLETVIWLHLNRAEGCTTNAMDYAAYNGHLDAIIWLHVNRTEGCTTDAMDWAARNEHLEVSRWLLEKTMPPLKS